MSQRHQLGDLQLAILRVLWARGEAAASDVHAALLEQRALAVTTIKTMLRKMEEPREWSPTARAMAASSSTDPLVDESDVREGMVDDLLQRMFQRGHGTALVNHLIEAGEIDADGDRRSEGTGLPRAEANRGEDNDGLAARVPRAQHPVVRPRLAVDPTAPRHAPARAGGDLGTRRSPPASSPPLRRGSLRRSPRSGALPLPATLVADSERWPRGAAGGRASQARRGWPPRAARAWPPGAGTRSPARSLSQSESPTPGGRGGVRRAGCGSSSPGCSSCATCGRLEALRRRLRRQRTLVEDPRASSSARPAQSACRTLRRAPLLTAERQTRITDRTRLRFGAEGDLRARRARSTSSSRIRTVRLARPRSRPPSAPRSRSAWVS